MRVSFWLVPTENYRIELDRIIRGLARRFDAPVFQPHVTIYSGTIEEFTDPKDILGAAAAGAGPFELQVAGVSFSSQFTKTLFIEFQRDARLSLLSETIRMSTARRDTFDLQPHLSLLYASLDECVKRELVPEIKPPERIVFDSIQAVDTGERNRSDADVERWRPLSKLRLA